MGIWIGSWHPIRLVHDQVEPSCSGVWHRSESVVTWQLVGVIGSLAPQGNRSVAQIATKLTLSDGYLCDGKYIG